VEAYDAAGNMSYAEVTFFVDTAVGHDDTNIYCQETGTNHYTVGPSSFTSGLPVPTANNTVLIASPTDGSSITGSTTIVKGAMDTTLPVNNVMIVISSGTGTAGYIAQVNGKYFAAKVPIGEETTTISAIATDQTGSTHKASVTVSVTALSSSVNLMASPGEGIPLQKGTNPATLEVNLVSTTTMTSPVVRYAWDFEGAGTENVTCYSHDNILASYQQTGLYLTQVMVMDSAGNQYKDTAIVNVLDKTEIDSKLKVIWNGMKGALIQGHADEAAGYFSSSTRSRYTEIFTALGQDQQNLQAIGQNMQDIQIIYVTDTTAKYRIKRDEVHGGQILPITYYIYFTKDSNGAWVLDRF
jgi:hypothetical protein